MKLSTITYVFLDQKRLNICEHTVKTTPRHSFGKVPPERVRGEEGMEGKLNGNHVRIIPGLYLEDRTN